VNNNKKLVLLTALLSTVLFSSFCYSTENLNKKSGEISEKKPQKNKNNSNIIIFKLKAAALENKSNKNVSAKNHEELIQRILTNKGLGKSRALHRKKGKNKHEVYYTEISESSNVDEIINTLRNDPEIEWVEKNFQFEIDSVIPNDPNYLDKQQRTMSVSGVDSAWEVNTGNDDVIIAIIDTGVDYNHPDLVNNIWHNQAEIANDGIDNDNNGYIDDVIGWDFTPGCSPCNEPMDTYPHGTHVAGIAAAEGNNGIGITGVSWHSKIMSLKIDLTLVNAAEALYYACDNGADVINMSFGNLNPSNALQEVLEYCVNKNIFLVAAAGNSSFNEPHYPASYSNVFSVGNISVEPTYVERNYGSTYGAGVDIAAPGSLIYSTIPGNQYVSMSGTSMAAPFVAGMAALLKSIDSSITNFEIRHMLYSMASYDDFKDKSLLTAQLGAGKAFLTPPYNNNVLKRNVLTNSIMKIENQYDGLISLTPSMRNFGVKSEDVTLNIQSTDPYLQILDDTVELNDILPNQLETNFIDSWSFTFSEDTPKNYVAEYTYQYSVGNPPNNINSNNQKILLNPTFISKTLVSPINSTGSFYQSKLLEHPDGKVSLFAISNYDFGFNSQIYHSVRELDGTWSRPVNISQIDNISTGRMSAIIGSDGILHLVYEALEGAGDTELYYGRFDTTQNTNTWITQKATDNAMVHNGSGISSKPTITLVDNSPMIFWTSIQDDTLDVFAAKFNGDVWGEKELIYDSTEPVNTSYGFPKRNNLAVHSLPSGEIILLILREEDEISQNVYLNRFMSYIEGNWSEVQLLENSSSGTWESIVDQNGTLHFLRTLGNINYHSKYENRVWSTTEIVDLKPYGSSKLLLNKHGNIVLNYYTRELLEKLQVYDGNNWLTPVTIHDHSATDFFESITATSRLESDIILLETDEILHTGFTRFFKYLFNYPLYNLHVVSNIDHSALSSANIIVSDAGEVTNTTLFSASWAQVNSNDNVRGYRYAIGSVPGGTDLLYWTQFQNTTSVNIQLPLKNGQRYFISVQVLDSRGYLSNIVSSDGIKYIGPNEKPSIAILSPFNGSVFSEDNNVIELSAIASDVEDSDLSTNVIWYSSIDGQIESVATLSEGSHHIVASVTDSGGLTSVDYIDITVGNGDNAVIRLNAGGTFDWPDSQGNVWLVDNSYASNGHSAGSNVAIIGTEDDTYYQSNRWSDSPTADPSVIYSIPVPEVGDYRVRLHFAEKYSEMFSAGARVMNVYAEEALKLSNIDVWASVGADTAYARETTVTVTDGVLNLRISKANPQTYFPMISGIEVLSVVPVGDTLPPNAPTGLSATAISDTEITLSWNPALDNGGGIVAGYNVYYQGEMTPINDTLITSLNYADIGLLANTEYAYTVTAVDDSGNESSDSIPSNATTQVGGTSFSLYLNAGGTSDWPDSQGNVWLVDNSYASNGYPAGSNVAIIGTEDDTYYQSNRWSDSPTADPSVIYSIPVPEVGDYRVRLHFAEKYSEMFSAGARVMNVFAEDTLKLSNIDVWASVGADTAYARETTVTVTDGVLNLRIGRANPQTYFPMISGIEVLSVASQ